MAQKPSGRTRHSYIQFYMTDWLAGTARMTRLIRSIYFDVCIYNWDKAKPMPEAELYLALHDIDGGEGLIDALVESGQLARDENRGVYCPRAIAEACRAFEAWESKSRGGKGKVKPVGREQEDTSKTLPTEKEKPVDPAVLAARAEKAAERAADVASLMEEWNKMAKIAKLTVCAKLTDERRKSAGARLDEYPLDDLVRAIRVIPASPFLMGDNDRGWKMNFDSLLVPKNCTKLIEGAYHNKGEGAVNAWTGR